MRHDSRAPGARNISHDVELSVDTVKAVNAVFAPPDRDIASGLLTEQCGSNLPLFEKHDAIGLERCRFAAIKVSDGDLEALRRAIELATVDWRDLLMQAGFERDVHAHEHWLAEMLLA